MTAVEWQFEQLFKAEKDWAKEVINGMQFIERKYEILAKAKEMEKEQMIKFAKHCLDKSIDLDILMAYNQVEIEYTNQTFKSE